MYDDPRITALHAVDLLRDGEARAVFRALIRDQDADARRRLRAAGAGDLDLGDAVLREWLLEGLEYRISPPDDDDLGVTRPTASRTLPFELLAA